MKHIAGLPQIGDDIPRRFVSFAAKFCHFFIDEERFPIYDEAARDAIRLHLGSGALTDDEVNPYRRFARTLAGYVMWPKSKVRVDTSTATSGLPVCT